MKSTYARRYRRHSSSSREGRMLKKDSQHEHTFFAAPSHESFFKPNIAIQRKCAHCEAEDKKVSRMGGDEEKKIQKMGDKKEEVHRQPDHKEDDKKIQKVEDKKEEVHRQPEHKEEEKKIQKVEDKKEEVHRQADHKEEDKKIQKVEDKKEEVHRQPDHKEEEKKIQKMGDKKEEEVHRQPEHKEEEKSVAKKESGATNNGMAATSSYIQSLNGKGNTLPGETLHFFGKRMGHDFSNVKIHTGIEAEKSAKEVNAKAYAVDNNIVFNKGQYNPASAEGKKLLAHELTHVVQQKGNGQDLLSRVTENAAGSHTVTSGGKATNSHNERAYGCEGVNIQGHTDANYADSYTAVGSATPSSKCTDECADDCVVATGTLVSVFQANPAVTLPSVPDGLSDCESNAVAKFINTTLNNHEQKHVAAFNIYNATIKTPYKFVGCQSNLDAYQQSLHDAINAKRQAAANLKSSKLDPFNPAIPCNCKED